MATVALPTTPFVNRTYDNLLQEMLAELPSTLDKREGSYIWDALAPVAAILADSFIKATLLLDYSFVETSYGAYLDAGVSEHGVTRNAAIKSLVNLTLTGAQGTVIPNATQFGTTVNPNSNETSKLFASTVIKTVQPRAGNGTFQEADNTITYTGTWTQGATTKYSSIINETAKIFFNGTSITIRLLKGPDKGKVGWKLDGGAETVVDLYAAAPANQDIVITPAAGNHDILLRVETKNALSSANTVDVDYFIVTGSVAPILDTVVIPLEAIAAGIAGNVAAGSITRLVSSLTGVISLTNPLAATGGKDQETDVELKARFKTYVSEPPGSGNKADYKRWAKAASVLVGEVDVSPLWNGNGTVKVFFLKVDGSVPDGSLITTVQNYIDPTPAGTGAGTAPIGATVTVVGPTVVPIDINVTITYATGFDPVSVRDSITANLKIALLAVVVAGTIRYADIANAIHDTPGVLDYSVLQTRRDAVAFGTTNIALAAGEKATLDVVTYS